MEKTNKHETKKEKQTPISYGAAFMSKHNGIGLLCATNKQNNSAVSINKPVYCRTCKQDLKADHATLHWNAEYNYAVVSFDRLVNNTCLGVKLIRPLGTSQGAVCAQCMLKD